jgi:hypothetical protein
MLLLRVSVLCRCVCVCVACGRLSFAWRPAFAESPLAPTEKERPQQRAQRKKEGTKFN